MTQLQSLQQNTNEKQMLQNQSFNTKSKSERLKCDSDHLLNYFQSDILILIMIMLFFC